MGFWSLFQSIKYLRSHAMWSDAPESMIHAARSNGPLKLAAAVWRAYLIGSLCACAVRQGTMVILVRTNDLSNKVVKKHPKLTNTEKTGRYAALTTSSNRNSHSHRSASQSALKHMRSSKFSAAARGRVLLPVTMSSLISAASVGSFWTAAMLACAIAAKSLWDAGAPAGATAGATAGAGPDGAAFFSCSAFQRMRHSFWICPVLAQY